MKKVFLITSIETVFYEHYIEADNEEDAKDILMNGMIGEKEIEWTPFDGVDWHIDSIQEVEEGL